MVSVEEAAAGTIIARVMIKKKNHVGAFVRLLS